MKKSTLVTLLVQLIFLSVSAQEQALNSFEDRPASRHDQYNQLNVFMPDIESILYNPEVQKNQKSGNKIEATGFRENSGKHFVIHFLKTKLHGEWQSFYDNNQACDSGRFQKNFPDGEWKTWYPNGQLKTVRNYSAKKYHYIKADLRRNHPKDQRYQITRYAQKDYNIGRYFLPVYQNTLLSPGLPILNKIDFNTSVDAPGYIAPFEQCIHHGIFINYDKNGLVLDSGNYVNGLKHDLWMESTPDRSERAAGYYHHGQRHGQWKYYNADGQLHYTETYQHGKKTSSFFFRKTTKS